MKQDINKILIKKVRYIEKLNEKLYKNLCNLKLVSTEDLIEYISGPFYLIEKVQRAFTKHISWMCFLSYSKRLEVLNCTHYREGERYMALFMCEK